MASSANSLSFLFLIFLISFAQIHARESKFFSKFRFRQHMTTTSSNNAIEDLPPTSAPAYSPEATPSYPPEALAITPTSAYPPGTYADTPGTAAFPPNTYADIPAPAYAPETYSSMPDRISTVEYSGASYGSKEFNMGYNKDNFNDDDDAANTKEYGMGDTRLVGNGNTYHNKYRKENTEDFTNNWSAGRKQEGMSDTRFMENGRYFYDVSKENYRHNEYRPAGRTGEDNSKNVGEYRTQQFELSEPRFQENGDNTNNYENRDDVSNNWPRMEKQGMSDTRFLENGRYSYDIDVENYKSNGYKPVSQSHGYFGSSRGKDSRNEFGSNEDEGEFNNSLRESQFQEGNQEEYEP